MSELEQEPETPLFSQLRLYNTVHDSYRYLMIWMWLGQFGTRLAGGKDHASARYIFTQMSPLARYYHVLTNSSTLFGFRKSVRLLEDLQYIRTVDVVNFVVATGIFCENKWWLVKPYLVFGLKLSGPQDHHSQIGNPLLISVGVDYIIVLKNLILTVNKIMFHFLR